MIHPVRDTGEAWMAGSSPMRLSASIPGLDDDPRWQPTTTCISPTSNCQSIIKDGLPQSFGKGMLDEEWYIGPDNALMDEMKELSYASSLASQADNNVSSAHFNLDSPHLQSFLSRNSASTSRPPPPFNTPDNNSRSSLSSFLDGGFSYGGDGSASNLLSNFKQPSAGGHVNTHNCTGSNSSSNAGLFLQSNGLGSRNSSGLLSNLSPRNSSIGDGFNNPSLGSNLSSILSSGINSSFNSTTTSPFSIGNGGYRVDGFSNSLSRTLLGGVNTDDSNSLLLNAERPPFRTKSNLFTSTVAPPGGSQLQQQQQTLFQKRALRHSVCGGGISSTVKSPLHVVSSASNDSSVDIPDEESPNNKNIILPGASVGCAAVSEFGLNTQQQELFQDKDDDDMDESGDGSGVLYETDDTLGMEGAGHGRKTHSGSLSEEKGKGKKGMPAKNLMAERRRRKKLNDRLYMLRSVVPKITKMDRASILGDAIEYLKELLQRISDLHTELDTAPDDRDLLPPLPPSPPPPAKPSSLPSRVKEESPSSLPVTETQPARVEVRSREGSTLNIHMFCERRPGLLLSTMRALDGLGLDVQQAVFSCFNGFALDVFKAEQSTEAEVGPEEIRAVLLHTASSNLSTL